MIPNNSEQSDKTINTLLKLPYFSPVIQSSRSRAMFYILTNSFIFLGIDELLKAANSTAVFREVSMKALAKLAIFGSNQPKNIRSRIQKFGGSSGFV